MIVWHLVLKYARGRSSVAAQLLPTRVRHHRSFDLSHPIGVWTPPLTSNPPCCCKHRVTFNTLERRRLCGWAIDSHGFVGRRTAEQDSKQQ